MNADCAFAIGASHTVCQDYARTTQAGGRTSAWLADGCSSSPDTDWGVRLLVQAAIKHEANAFTEAEAGTLPEAFLAPVTKTALRAVKNLQLAPTCLDATLLGIVADEAAGFRVIVYGDGVAVLGRWDGTVEVHEIAYARNYPLYLNYRTDAPRAARWAAEEGNERQVTVTRFCSSFRQVSDRIVTADTSAQPLVLGGDPREFRFAALFSDGVTSFTQTAVSDLARMQSHCDLHDILPDLLAIKNWTGAFVQRRVQRFTKDAQARGVRHQDDLAVAIVHFGE